MEFTSVTIIIGTTNEKESLMCTVDTIMDTCRHEDINKLLLVKSKDASEDCNRTIELLEKKYPGKVQGLEQTRPYVGGAIRDGMDAVTSSHTMLLPSDMAISLSCVSEMIERVKEKPDVISKTSRWLKKNSFHNYNPTRKIFNSAAQIFLRILYGVKLTDFTSPVQTAPTEAYRKSDWQELNFPFLLEMVLVPLRLGYKFEEIPVECFERQEGFSRNSTKQTALYLKTALRVRFTPKSKLIREN
jgi:hypothetical protein